MRCVQIVESRRNDARIQLLTDPLPNDTQQGANVRTGSPLGWSSEGTLDIIVRLPYDLIVRVPDYPIADRFHQEVAEVTTAVVDSPENEQAQAWWFLDTLVVEHRCAPEMETVVLEMTLPVGSAPPLHVHDDLDDTWYILEGEMVVRCGDDELVVGAGHWVSMPRGVPHTFRVVGDREARILLVHDNASFRDLIRDLGSSGRRTSCRPSRVSADGRTRACRCVPRPQADRAAA